MTRLEGTDPRRCMCCRAWTDHRFMTRINKDCEAWQCLKCKHGEIYNNDGDPVGNEYIMPNQEKQMRLF